VTASVPRREVEPPPTRRPLLVFVPLVLFAALAALFVIRLYSGDSSLLPSALIGRQVPAFALPAVEGLPDKPGFSDADLRQGKVTLVNVFASWCVPCHQEHELIMRLSADHGLAGTCIRAVRPSWAWSRPQGEGLSRNQRNNPMQLPMHRASKCRARTRSGKPCQAPAMSNGRCRMHGGMSPGAPKGNKNAFKHGRYTAEVIERHRETSELVRAMRALARTTRELE
jgi:thiol-disulfide isomerase/thioredoxin